ALERGEIFVGVRAALEPGELRLQDVARVLLLELGGRLGLGLDLIDLAGHALERLEGALILETVHGLLNRLLRLGALLPRDEDVLLPLRLLDLVVQHPKSLLQLIDRGLLLRPLLLEGVGELVVLLLPRERLLRELLVAGA